MLILCLSEGRRKKRRREGAEAARSRRCQLPISWAFFNILNCLAECVAPVPVPAQVPVPFPDPDPDPALGQHLSESSLPQIACCFYCLLLLLLFLLLVAVVAVAVFAAVSCAARASFIKKQLQCYGQFDARCSVLVPMGYRCVCVCACVCTHTRTYIPIWSWFMPDDIIISKKSSPTCQNSSSSPIRAGFVYFVALLF